MNRPICCRGRRLYDPTEPRIGRGSRSPVGKKEHFEEDDVGFFPHAAGHRKSPPLTGDWTAMRSVARLFRKFGRLFRYGGAVAEKNIGGARDTDCVLCVVYTRIYSQLSNIIGQLCESSGYLCSVIGQDSVADILHKNTRTHSEKMKRRNVK